MHSQIYSGLRLIFAIVRKFRVAGTNEFIRVRWALEAGASGSICTRWANIVVFYPISQKKDSLGPLFRWKNDKNRACVTKSLLSKYRNTLR